MKRILLAAVAAVSVSTAAVAQPAPVFNWTGFYIGGSAGYVWAPVDWQYYNLTPAAGYLESNTRSFAAAGHVGYQWQRGNFVYGLEASYQLPTKIARQCDAPIFCAAFDSFVQLNNLATIGPRFGYTPNNSPWMAYVTGGFAVAHVRSGFHARGFPNISANTNDYHSGWFAGAGVEYAYSRNIMLGLEYMHVDLSTELHSSTSVPATGAAHFISPSADIVRLRISFREVMR